MIDMGIFDEHMKIVAKRQAKKMQNGATEKEIRKYLKSCHWNDDEIDKMIKIANRHFQTIE